MVSAEGKTRCETAPWSLSGHGDKGQADGGGAKCLSFWHVCALGPMSPAARCRGHQHRPEQPVEAGSQDETSPGLA